MSLETSSGTAQVITRNTVFLLASDVISKMLSFVYMLLMARYLGAGGLGVISFASAFSALFVVFTDMGLGTLTTREVARDKSRATSFLYNSLSIKLILIVLSFGAMVFAINLMHYPQETVQVVYIIGLATCFGVITQTFQSIFQAFERMQYTSLGVVISAVVMLAGGVLIILLGFSLVHVALVYLAAEVLTMAYSAVICGSKFLTLKLKAKLEFWKGMFREGWPFGLFIIVGLISSNISIVMLSALKNSEAVGYYQAALSIVTALQFVPLAIISSFFPKLSQYFGNNVLLESMARKMNRLLFTIGILLTAGTLFFAHRVIPVVYGAGYEPAIVLLQMLSPFLFLTYIPADGVILNAINRQQSKFYAGVAMLITNVILNVILIPRYGAIGAASATIASLVVLRIGYVWMVRLEGLRTFNLDLSLLMITVVGAGTAFVFGRVFTGLNLFVSIVICSALYLGVAYFWFAKKDEREFINSTFFAGFFWFLSRIRVGWLNKNSKTEKIP